MKKLVLFSFLFTLIINIGVFAATKTWAGGTGTGLDWTSGANWGGTAPVAGDDVVFNTAGTITFSTMMLASNDGLNSLTISQGNITLANSASRTVTLGGNAGTDLTIASGASLTLGTNVNITLASSATADISGTLTINSGRTYNTNGNSVVTTVTGTIVNAGTVTNSTASKLLFNNGSKYQHNFANGGTVPTATWNSNSTVEIIGALTGTSEPGNLDQSFGNFIWNPVSQTSVVNLSGNLTIVNGNFTISVTGSSELRLSSSDITLDIGGNFNLTGGTLNPVNSNNDNVDINLSGDFNYTGGALTQSLGNAATDAQFFFVKAGTQVYNSSGVVGGNIDFIVNSGSTLSLGANIVNGRNFTLSPGGGIEIGSTAGITSSGATGNIQVTGTRTFDAGANYIYNGGSAQVTGNGLTTANNLTIDNSAGVTLSNAITVNGILTLTDGIVNTFSSNLLTLGTGGSTSGGSSSSFINGPMAKIKNTTSLFTFPVGKGTTFRTIGVTPTSTSTTTFTAEYFDTPYSDVDPPFGAGLEVISAVEYFVLDRSGTANASVTLEWGANSLVSDMDDLRVANYQGVWLDMGNASTSGSNSSGFITSNEVSTFSPFTLASSTENNALPVELSSFTASPKGNDVILNWETKTEVQNYGFEIERCQMSNVKSQQEWNNIGFVKGHGNSNSPKEYSFVDSKLTFGTYSYRLKQIDTDGGFEYSKVVEVDFSVIDKFSLEQNYPNPFNPSTTIKFGFDKMTKSSLRIYDVLGNEVAILFNGTAEGGRIYELNFDASNLSSGVYYYKLSGDNRTEIKKMMLLK